MRLICTTNKAYSPDLHVFELQCNWVVRSARRCPLSPPLCLSLFLSPSIPCRSSLLYLPPPGAVYNQRRVDRRISQYRHRTSVKSLLVPLRKVSDTHWSPRSNFSLWPNSSPQSLRQSAGPRRMGINLRFLWEIYSGDKVISGRRGGNYLQVFHLHATFASL